MLSAAEIETETEMLLGHHLGAGAVVDFDVGRGMGMAKRVECGEVGSR